MQKQKKPDLKSREPRRAYAPMGRGLKRRKVIERSEREFQVT